MFTFLVSKHYEKLLFIYFTATGLLPIAEEPKNNADSEPKNWI
jgi:hypothetical protein